MKIKFLSDGAPTDHLILFFAGWAMDWRPFDSISYPGYDVAVAYDYEDFECEDIERLKGYGEIVVVAWSFGVAGACVFCSNHPDLHITRSVAINGTMWPVHDTMGIPGAIFDGTLRGLNDRNLRKFYRRMFGDVDSFNRFVDTMPRRDMDNIMEELRVFADLSVPEMRWDAAYVGLEDRILPAHNQLIAWEHAGVTVKSIDAPHYMDFQSVISSEVSDKRRLAAKFSAAASSYDENASIQKKIAERLWRSWHSAMTDANVAPEIFNSLIEAGPGTGLFTRFYAPFFDENCLTLWDLSNVPEDLPGKHMVCDAETEILTLPTSSVDGVVTSSALQWFNSPCRFIAESARVLSSGGWLVMSVFGPHTFREIRENHFPSYESVNSWLEESGMKVLVSEEIEETVNFDNTRQLMRHIKHTGVNGYKPDAANVGLARRLMESGLRDLTYHWMFFVARK